MSRFLVTPEDNIFNYYVLPLVGVNKESFNSSFVKTFLNKECTKVFVEVIDFNDKNFFVDMPCFRKASSYRDKLFYVWNIPEEFQKDVKLIADGHYSKIEVKTKELIKRYSGLSYNYRTGSGSLITSKAIFALDRHPALINFFMKTLDLTAQEVNDCIVVPETELMDKPSSEDFIEFYLKLEESV